MTNEESQNKKVVSVVPIEVRRGTINRLNRVELFRKRNSFEEINFETEAGSFRILVPKKLVARFKTSNYEELLTKVLAYHQKILKEGLNEKIKKGGCTTIAGKAILDLGIRERDSGILSGSGSDKGLVLIPFYKDLGYNYHGVNYVNLNNKLYISFDLTSHISLNGNENQSQLFAIVGNSTEEISDHLNRLMGIKNWRVNHS